MPNFNLFHELDQIIGHTLADMSTIHIGSPTITPFSIPSKPKLDLHENSEQNLITAILELPGVKKEDIELNVHNNVLIVSAERKIPANLEEKGYTLRERRYGKLSRTLTLPEGVKETDIWASMSDGVLTITFPKSSPEEEPKRIITIA